MSLYCYLQSRVIDAEDYQFRSLIMAAMRKADDKNLALLKGIYPLTWEELQARYNAPGGILEGEEA